MKKAMKIMTALSIYLAAVCIAFLCWLEFGALTGCLGMCARSGARAVIWLGMILLIPILPAIPAYLFWNRYGKKLA